MKTDGKINIPEKIGVEIDLMGKKFKRFLFEEIYLQIKDDVKNKKYRYLNEYTTDVDEWIKDRRIFNIWKLDSEICACCGEKIWVGEDDPNLCSECEEEAMEEYMEDKLMSMRDDEDE